MTENMGLSRRSYLHHTHPDRLARYERKYGDKTTPKYFIYFLNDADGNAVYIDALG